MEAISASAAATRATLSQRPEMLDLRRHATLAPNGHNTQPWRFRVGQNRIEIVPDFSRRTPIVDPDDHHIFVSLGCAAENWHLPPLLADIRVKLASSRQMTERWC